MTRAYIIKLISRLKEVAERGLVGTFGCAVGRGNLMNGLGLWGRDARVLIEAYVTHLPVELEPSLVSAKTR